LKAYTLTFWVGTISNTLILRVSEGALLTEGVNAWVDPQGYRRFIASKRRAFEDEVDKEMGKAQ
jgi:hypothetical protein